MKNRLWLLQIPIILVFTAAFCITELGVEGKLENTFLRERVFPKLRNISTAFTDVKFKVRGPQPPKNKVVIIEIDSPSIETIGRWPWHRDATAYLIDKAMQAGAKVVGLDMVFSEPDKRVPDELAQVLQGQNLGHLTEQFETDKHLEQVITKHKDKLVLGWTTDSACQPAWHNPCPVTDPQAIATHPEGFDKFAYQSVDFMQGFQPEKTPLMSVLTFIANLPAYNTAANHSAYFNAFPDPDGYIRRTSLVMMANGKPYPSLPLEMARVGLGENLKISFDKNRVNSIEFANAGRKIPISPMGVMEVNFRGPGYTFPYVSAIDLMSDDDTLKDELNRKLAGVKKSDILRDAYVLIGVSALGVFDMRAFPFDSNVPGVEGHANILDNLLSGDALIPSSSVNGSIMILLVMIIGAGLFGYGAQRLEAVPALLLFLIAFAGVSYADVKVLFEHNLNWNTSFLALEMVAIFVFTVAAKYVIEERNKKFVKGAFAKYVAPAVVDSILKDPTKLTVGGEKKELTILFSDIRSFTTFSERMDAKALSSFLNEYLGIMTDIVFAHEGTLDKYIGDAIMAFWGAPLDQPKHATNACKAAVAMMRALRENKARWKQQYDVDVNIGVGLNSGVVSVGNMGSMKNFAFTVIGDHVNLASRLEGLTKYYGVGLLTSRFTFDVIKSSGEQIPAHRILDFVKVKGKKNAVELIELLDREISPEGLKVFEEAFKLYRERKWDEAIAKFTESGKLLSPGEGQLDGPSQMYIERCVEFKTTSPGDDWDGSYEMHSK